MALFMQPFALPPADILTLRYTTWCSGNSDRPLHYHSTYCKVKILCVSTPPQPRSQEHWNLRTLLQPPPTVCAYGNCAAPPLPTPPQAAFMLTAHHTSQRWSLGELTDHQPSGWLDSEPYCRGVSSQPVSCGTPRCGLTEHNPEQSGLGSESELGLVGWGCPSSQSWNRGLTLQVVTKSCVCTGWFLARPPLLDFHIIAWDIVCLSIIGHVSWFLASAMED